MTSLIRSQREREKSDMKKRGSITVFAALSFMLITSFLTALLEAGRMYQLDAYADMSSELAIESVCAEYQPVLWEEFHLLGLDGAYGGEIFSMKYVTAVLSERLRTNLGQRGAGSAIMALSTDRVEPIEYQLLTDGNGGVFLECVADYMKENLSMETARILYDRYMEQEAADDNAVEENSVENAKTAIEEAKRKRQEENAKGEVLAESGGGTLQEPVEVGENPLDVVLSIKQNALLGMVTENLNEVSAKQVNLADTVSSRKREVGTAAVKAQVDWYDRILVLEYLDQYFGDYREPAENHALSYELEYILCGKSSDRDNFEGVIKRLMLMREAANITHILSDSGKMGSSLTIAEALAGFTGNPAVIKVVQIGIVAAWAYVESILDLRALLNGERIALFKTDEQWTTDLGGLAQAFADGGRAKDCTNGFTYQDYLKGLLFTMRAEKLSYRMMDVMEKNIRQIPAYANCRMDHILCGIHYEMNYTAEPLFSKISVPGTAGIKGLEYQKEKEFAYY